jgi:hypothetical protein
VTGIQIAFWALGLLSIVLWTFAIDQLLPLHLKKYALAVSISAISLFLYQTTFFLGYFNGQHVVYFLSLAVFIRDFFGQKKFPFFLKGQKWNLALIAAWAIISSRGQFVQWDEFSWGGFLNHLNYFGTYWDSKAAIMLQHLRYFPGATVWESFFLGQKHYTEGPVYFSLGLIFIASLIALLPDQRSFKKNFAVLLLFLSAVTWFSTGITTIYIDGPMGILLGLAAMAVFDAKRPIEFAVSILILLFLAITKESGLLLSLVIFLMMSLKILFRRYDKRGLLVVVLGLTALALNQQLWKYHVSKDPLSATFDPNVIFAAMNADLQQLSARSREILDLVGKALFNRSFPDSAWGISFIGSPIFWTLLFTGFFALARKGAENLIAYFLGLCGYTLFLTTAYMYFFSEYEAHILVSFERYLGVYFLAFALLAIKMTMEEKLYRSKIFLVFWIALILIYRPRLDLTFPYSLRGTPINQNRAALRPFIDKIKQHATQGNRVWFVLQNSDGFEAMMVRYEIAPIRMNTSDWSIGDMYFEKDIFTIDLTYEEFRRRAATYDFMMFARVDENFQRRYGQAFEKPPTSGAIYKRISAPGEELKMHEIQ